MPQRRCCPSLAETISRFSKFTTIISPVSLMIGVADCSCPDDSIKTDATNAGLVRTTSMSAHCNKLKTRVTI